VSEKCFKERKEIAKNMEQKFLETYFGSNEEILKIAKKLIFALDDKEVLRELNKAVSILGMSDPDPIVTKFNRKLDQKFHETWAEAAAAEAESGKYGAWELVAMSLIGFVMLVFAVIAAYS
jgi:uncharacterized protein YjgD (DUF1641 family)